MELIPIFREIYQTALFSAESVSILFVFARIMGKKQVAHLTFFDYAIGISIGSIAAQWAVDRSIHTAAGVTGMAVFTLFSLALSFISAKSYAGRKLLDGTPTVLIENGLIIEAGLKKAKLNVNDLLEECRQKDAFDVAQVEFAILETSGKLSVRFKPPNRPLTAGDAGIPPNAEGLCVNLVIDGRVITGRLRDINRDESWLAAELGKCSVTDISGVLLAYLDGAGVLHTHLKGVKAANGGFTM